MKKGINLLTKQKKYQNIEKLFRSLKIGIVLMTGIFLIIDAVSLFQLFSQNQTINSLDLQKASYLQTLTQNKEVEAQFVYFVSKEKQISNILKNDVNFYPYYSILNASLSSSSPAATLQKLIINTDKTTEFTVGFNDFASLLNFLKFSESDFFLKSFTQLHLTNFTINSKQNSPNLPTQLNNYTLNFSGTFKQI